MKLEASELVRYNANTRGTSIGDCTARAISLAFKQDYSKVRKLMNASVKGTYMDYNNLENCKKVIIKLGGGPMTTLLHSSNPKISVGDFADSHTGTYIIWCSKNGTKNSPQHLVCIINSTIYDSWDSRTYFVLGYWEITSGIKGEDITDVGTYLKTWINRMDAQGYRDYANKIFDNIVGKNRRLKKLADKYGVDIHLSLEVNEVSLVKNYTFNFGYTIRLKIPDFDVLEYYKGKFSIVFNPTMNSDEVEPYFEDTFYGKFYSFIQNVVYKAEDACEGCALIKDTNLKGKYKPWAGIEARSFRALPYWVQRLTTYFNVRNPFDGEYSDSFELHMVTPSFDTEYGQPNCETERYFIAYCIGDLKAGLEYYKKTGDYNKAYEIAQDF